MSRSPRQTGARASKSKRPSGAPAGRSEAALKIGDAARVVGVKPFVLRFWETQFAFLKPSHARFKHRVYEPEDIENLRLVKRLLHEERFTIEGAKKHLRQFGLEQVRNELAAGPARPAKRESADEPRPEMRQALADIKRELVTLHKLLGE